VHLLSSAWWPQPARGASGYHMHCTTFWRPLGPASTQECLSSYNCGNTNHLPLVVYAWKIVQVSFVLSSSRKEEWGTYEQFWWDPFFCFSSIRLTA